MSQLNSQEKASAQQWLAVFGSIVGAFMAILDISITNSSLQNIQGALSATLDEGAWISTAYLVAEIIVIPITGWLCQVFSLKKYLLTSLIAFLIFSMACGFAWNLPSMIFFRIFQGIAGGVLIPLSATIIVTELPMAQRPLGLTFFGIAATFAPAIGPTVGGWLTVNFDWPYIFFINLIPGVIMFLMVNRGLEKKPMQLDLLKKGDWVGIALMSTALGSFTTILEEGARKDWFSSNLIFSLSIIFIPAFIGFIYWELKTEHPVIQLRLLTRRNFLFSNILALILGFGMYGSAYMLPVFLAQIQRLNAFQIGSIVMWAGLPQLIVLPFIPTLVKKFDNRYLIGTGMLLFGSSALMNSHLTHEWARDQFFWSQIVRAIGQPLILTPLSNLAYVGIANSEIGSASGLYNMMRNLGGSIGIGSLGTLLVNRYHLHFTRLAEATSFWNLPVQQAVTDRSQSLAATLGTGGGAKAAIASVYASMNKESLTVSYNDAFLVMALLFYAGALCLFIMKKPAAGATVVADH